MHSDGGKYKMIDGIIVFNCGNFNSINSSLSLSLNVLPYIEEPEPFKIEVGKFYKTRGGEKARCFSIDVRLAYFIVDEKLFAFSTYPAGNVFNSKAPCEYDIIGPWEE